MKLEVNGGKEELMKTEENTSHWDIVAYKKKKKEKEMEENIWREYIFVRKVFEEGKLMLTPTKQTTGQILWNMPFRRLENKRNHSSTFFCL